MAYFPNNNQVSETLSTTGVLASGATWTSDWVDVSQYDSAVIAVATDKKGSYTLQFSINGSDVDSTLTRYYRTNQINPPHRYTITRQYARVTFTNDDTTTQTYLRLQTVLGDKSDLNIPIDALMAPDYDSISTRPTDYHYEVALGRRQGHSTWNKFGYNNDLDNGVEETVWAAGGLLTINSTGSFVTAVSTSADDISGGSGATAITIQGVDQNWDLVSEVLQISGTTGVQSANQYIGINRSAVFGAGSGFSNQGDITLTDASANTQALIPTGEGTTQQVFFFVPRNHQVLADWLAYNATKIGVGSEPVIDISIWVSSYVSNSRYLVYSDTIDVAVENHVQLNPEQPFIVGEKSCIEMRAESDTNNTALRGRLSLILVEDVDA